MPMIFSGFFSQYMYSSLCARHLGSGRGENSSSLSWSSGAQRFCQRIAQGAGGKGPRQKTSKKVKKRQKVSKSFSTLFDNFRVRQKKSKIVKKSQEVFRHFSTVFARHHIPAPLGGSEDQRFWIREIGRASFSQHEVVW